MAPRGRDERLVLSHAVRLRATLGADPQPVRRLLPRMDFLRNHRRPRSGRDPCPARCHRLSETVPAQLSVCVAAGVIAASLAWFVARAIADGGVRAAQGHEGRQDRGPGDCPRCSGDISLQPRSVAALSLDGRCDDRCGGRPCRARRRRTHRQDRNCRKCSRSQRRRPFSRSTPFPTRPRWRRRKRELTLAKAGLGTQGRVVTSQRSGATVASDQVRRAAANQALAARTVDRLRPLAAQGYVPKQQLDQAEVALRDASTSLAQAQEQKSAARTAVDTVAGAAAAMKAREPR